MKRRSPVKYPLHKSPALKRKETGTVTAVETTPMIRTQIYLSQREYDFLQAEAAHHNKPMAAVIRGIIDEKMEIPEEAWTNNPMLKPTPEDSHFHLPEDAAINHDHYLYGTPKKYVKAKGRWVLAAGTRS